MAYIQSISSQTLVYMKTIWDMVKIQILRPYSSIEYLGIGPRICNFMFQVTSVQCFMVQPSWDAESIQPLKDEKTDWGKNAVSKGWIRGSNKAERESVTMKDNLSHSPITRDHISSTWEYFYYIVRLLWCHLLWFHLLSALIKSPKSLLFLETTGKT